MSKFKPPIVTHPCQGTAAFHAYDWYYYTLMKTLAFEKKVFLTPCAATKPIYSSSLHKAIYQKFAEKFAGDRELLVVSEPVVLIRYSDLYEHEKHFFYDFPPKFLFPDSRKIFVERLRLLLSGKNIIGCLPRHHASLINDAVGIDWKNYWHGDFFAMVRKAAHLTRTSAP